MATYNKFNANVANFANGVVNLASDTPIIALTDTVPVATNSVLADITQIAYTNLSSRTCTVTSSTQTSGVLTYLLQQLTVTASGNVAQFRYIVLYDSTAAGSPLIGWWDYGSELNMVSGESLVIGFDQVNGVLTIT